jgi:hypothetical protein
VKPDKELCEAILGLRENRAWKIFLEALKEDELLNIQRALQLEGPPCHRAQGAALKLQEIRKFIDDAPANFEKLRNQQPTQGTR